MGLVSKLWSQQILNNIKLTLKLPIDTSLHKSNFFGGMTCLPDLVVRELEMVLVEVCWVTLDLIVLLGILGVTLIDSRNISSPGFSSLGWSSRISSAFTLALWVESLRCLRLRRNWRFPTCTTYDLGASWCLTIVPGTHFLSPCWGMMRTGSVGYKGNSSLFLHLMSKLAFCLSLTDCKLCLIQSRFWPFGRKMSDAARRVFRGHLSLPTDRQ